MKQEQAIRYLKEAWSNDGILFAVRLGRFDDIKAKQLVSLLRSIRIEVGELLLPEFVTYVWQIPAHVIDHSEFIDDRVVTERRYRDFHAEVLTEVQRILGSA